MAQELHEDGSTRRRARGLPAQASAASYTVVADDAGHVLRLVARDTAGALANVVSSTTLPLHLMAV